MEERTKNILNIIKKYNSLCIKLPRKTIDYYSGNFIAKLIIFFKENYFLSDKQIKIISDTIEKLENIENDIDKIQNKFSEFKDNDFYDEQEIQTFLTNEIDEILPFIESKNGVYFIYNKNNEIVYIGKSKNLKTRMLQSLANYKGLSFSFIITNTHIDACVLELYYIGKYKPVFNHDPIIIDDVTINISHNYKMSKVYKLKVKDVLNE